MEHNSANEESGQQARVTLGTAIEAAVASNGSGREDGSHEDFVAATNGRYFPVVRAQFPGLLETLTDPAVEVQSLQLDDVEIAIDSLERRWKSEGCENVENDLERIGEVFDALRGEPGIPLPVGTMLLIIVHGPMDGRKRICVPVRTDTLRAAG